MTKTKVVSFIMRVLGNIFLAHGVAKFQMGIGNVTGWFHSLGIPRFMAYVIAVLELVGGILLILGIYSLCFCVVRGHADPELLLRGNFLSGFLAILKCLGMSLILALFWFRYTWFWLSDLEVSVDRILMRNSNV